MLQLVDLKDTDFQNSKVASIGNVLVFHRKPHEMSVNRKQLLLLCSFTPPV